MQERESGKAQKQDLTVDLEGERASMARARAEVCDYLATCGTCHRGGPRIPVWPDFPFGQVVLALHLAAPATNKIESGVQ